MPLTDEQRAAVLIDYCCVIDAMTQGRGTAKHLATLVYAVNIALLLAEAGVGEEYGEMIYSAMAAVKRCSDRGEAHGHYGLDGLGIQALRDFYDLHEAQLKVALRDDINKAIAEFKRRADMGLKFQEREGS